MTHLSRARRRSLAAASALAVVAAMLGGCALLFPPSPTSTVTDASGNRVTLSWSDYPGTSEVDPAEVLEAPRAETAEAYGDTLLVELQTAIDVAAPGLTWMREFEGGVHAGEGNGYGGSTPQHTLNSAQLRSDSVPADWLALTSAIDAELATHGYGPLVWDFEREPWGDETIAERDAGVLEEHGTLDPSEMWRWDGMAHNGAMWVSVYLQDAERGLGAPAGHDVGSPQMIVLMVGGTVIPADAEQSYREGVAPFEGLERPEPTES